MSDIRHSLLRRDALSAAKEVLYHLDIYFSSQLQNAPLPIVDKGPVELLEEFVFQVPKERGAQPKVRQGPQHPRAPGRQLPAPTGCPAQAWRVADRPWTVLQDRHWRGAVPALDSRENVVSDRPLSG